jgi:hypothetical protein
VWYVQVLSTSDLEMGGVLRNKPVDEEEYSGIPWALSPNSGDATWLIKPGWVNIFNGQSLGVYFCRGIPEMISLANGNKIEVDILW